MTQNENFRDKIYTADTQGHRKWVFATKPFGKLYQYRTILSVLYLATFFIIPFIKLNGHPLFLFDVIERKFILFGVIFWPQDFFVFALGMLTFIVFIVFFTVVYGRIFCGWACPQTIFMEMVFRKIEYFIEGNADQQKHLSQRPWDAYKISRKVLKHSIFFLFSFIISNTFLAYIIGTDDLFKIMQEPVAQNVGGFIAIFVFTFVFYAVFAFAREMVCTFACPYGRLQGVLLDKNSIVVAYDYKRGEPRGKIKHNDQSETHGDCIDCHLCVRVCPTGIDIRNGTQLECVNCTACIDACDSIMEKIQKPKGLIRFASENQISLGQKLQVTPRMVAYSFVLATLVIGLSFILVSRKHIDASISRSQGQLFQKADSTHYSNLYNIKIINKTLDSYPITLRLDNREGSIKMIGNALNVEPESYTEGTFFLLLEKEELTQKSLEVQISVLSKNEVIETIHTSFFGPLLKLK